MRIDLALQDVTKKFQEFTAVDAVSFEVPSGSFFSILGPSGCGKTTLLRMIAGFTEPTTGRLEINGMDMRGVSPNRRPVNLIFQHLALFPMMDVAENVAFGLKRRREAKPDIPKKVDAILERVGLAGFGPKKISQLSGGQMQRVALARSLVLEPAVLLLDEPLGALDLKLRDQMKVELKNLQAEVGTTFVYITHDQSEALVMSDKVAVMKNGRFEQLDTPTNLYRRPKTSFVAQFVGENNAWPGTVQSFSGPRLQVSTSEGYAFSIAPPPNLENRSGVHMFLRPEALQIMPDPDDRELNRFQTRVKSILFDGAKSRLLTTPLNSNLEIQIALPQNRQFDDIKPDDQVEIGWHPEAGICFPRTEDQQASN